VLKYVDSVASQQVPPPYEFPNTTVHAFIWEPDLSKVKAYCDRFLNIGDLATTGVSYEPLAIWPYAALLVIHYPVMTCADPARKTMYRRPAKTESAPNPATTPSSVQRASPTDPETAGESDDRIPYADRGYTSQTEVFITFPLLRRGHTLRRLALDTMIEWAIPLIIVENAESAICGREMLGLEKLCSNITLQDKEMEGDGTNLFTALVELPGWKSASPEATQEMLPFFEATAGPLLPSALAARNETSVWSLLRSRTASAVVEAAGVTRDFLDDALMGLLPSTMQVVALKQFRDAANPANAVYQALVGCRSKFSNINNFRPYNENNVSLKFHNSGSFHPIVEELFGPTASKSPDDGEDPVYLLPTVAAFRFNARIDFDEMRTLHTFPVKIGNQSRPPDDWIVPWLRPWKGFVMRTRPRPPSGSGAQGTETGGRHD
jgi:hypothetical protein